MKRRMHHECVSLDTDRLPTSTLETARRACSRTALRLIRGDVVFGISPEVRVPSTKPRPQSAAERAVYRDLLGQRLIPGPPVARRVNSEDRGPDAAIARLLNGLESVMEPGESHDWLVSPHAIFDGCSPTEMIQDGREADVWDQIAREFAI